MQRVPSSTINSRPSLSQRWTPALQMLGGFSCAVFAVHALAAPVVVTPTNLQGWALYDGSSGTSPAKITGTQPYEGNGSLQFDISASNQQPSAYHALNAVRFGDLLGSNMSFGFSYLLPVGSPPATSPTIRLLLSGLSGVTQPPSQGVPRTDGSLGWYANGAGDGMWHTNTFSMTSGDFFFRVGGVGQESLGCTSTSGAFDDRRQTLAQWATACTGAGGTADIDDASVVGIQVDWGSFSTTVPVSAFADRINYNIATNVGDFNFEVTDAAAVPEPASVALSLLALGLAGAATVGKRQQRKLA